MDQPLDFSDPGFNCYAQAALVLTGSVSHESLLDRARELNTEHSSEFQREYEVLNTLLFNVRDSEGVLIDYLSEIASLRKRLQACLVNLAAERPNPTSIWLKKLFLLTVRRSFKDLLKVCETLQSVRELAQLSLYERAAETARRALYSLSQAEFSYLPVYEVLKEAFEGQLVRLVDCLMADLKAALFLRHVASDFRITKYFTVGVLDIGYFLTQHDEEDLSGLIRQTLNGLETAQALDRLHNSYFESVGQDIVKLFKECLSQISTTEVLEHPRVHTHSIQCLLPSEEVQHTVVRVVNSLVALSALVLRNHLLLKQQLKEFNKSLDLQLVYEALLKEMREVLRGMGALPTAPLRNSLSLDMLRCQQWDSPYSQLLETLLPISPYNLLGLYPLLRFYVGSFQQSFALIELSGESLGDFYEDYIVKVLKTLSSDTINLYLNCTSNPENFKPVKTKGYLYPATSVFIEDLQMLLQVYDWVPNQKGHSVKVLYKLLYLFLKEANERYSAWTTQSEFEKRVLKNPAYVHDLRADPNFRHAHVPAEFFATAPGCPSPLYAGLREQMTRFNHPPWTSYIEDCHKLGQLAILVHNIDQLLSAVLGFVETHLEGLIVQSVRSSVDESSSTFSSWSSSEVGLHRLTKYIREALDLHDKALFLIQGELEGRVYFHLNRLKARNYWSSMGPIPTEEFVPELASELRESFHELKRSLNKDKLAYVFHTVFDVLVTMLIFGLREVEDARLSDHGIAAYKANAKLLENELVPLKIPGFPQKAAFLKLKEFLSLLTVDEAQLRTYVRSNPGGFTAAELGTMAKLIVPARPRGMPQATLNEINALSVPVKVSSHDN